MEAQTQQKPTAVKVISTIAILVSLVMIVGAYLEYAAYGFVNYKGAKPTLDEAMRDDGWFWVFSYYFFKYLNVIALLQFLIATTLMVTAIGFLKQREWARNALQKVGWTAYLFLLLFSFVWFLAYVTHVSESKGGISIDIIIAPVIAIAINVLCVRGLAVSGKTLRSAAVRNAMIH